MTSEKEAVSKPFKPELLSPAGDWESLEAAVLNGADAVYLGTKDFNARINARNFTSDDLKKAVDYCHRNGVKIYLTMNILVKNNETQKYFETLSRAYAVGIDGVIIQHISFIEIIKQNYPGLAVFVSTQGAVGNNASASIVKAADRIILPREIKIEDIKRMAEAGYNVEVFVHGALCFSYSGLCLFSSFISNRSGNRGSCAQICRQEFNGTYPLSTRELCLVNHIPELIKAGVYAFKIEGRMRSSLYVAAATRLYRKAIDSYMAGDFKLPEKEMEDIEVVFNREFTEGLTFDDRKILSPEKPNNRGASLGVIEKGEITLQRDVHKGDGVGIWNKSNITGGKVMDITRNGIKIDSAAKGETVHLGLGAKDGARIYLTSTSSIHVKPDFTITRPPLKTELRQQVRANLPRVEKQKAPLLQRFLSRAYSLEEAREIAESGADIVFYDIFAEDFPEISRWNERTAIGAYIPRILTDQELNNAVSICSKKNPAAVLTGNLGLLARRNSIKVPVYLDYTMNVFNDLDILYYRQLNVVPIVSPELTMMEITSLRDREVVIMVHGDIPLVNTKIEIEAEKLTDNKGYVFPVRKEHGYWQILNSQPYGIFSDIRKIRNMQFNQFYVDQQGQSARYVLLYRDMLRKEVNDRNLRKGFTSGHLYKSV